MILILKKDTRRFNKVERFLALSNISIIDIKEFREDIQFLSFFIRRHLNYLFFSFNSGFNVRNFFIRKVGVDDAVTDLALQSFQQRPKFVPLAPEKVALLPLEALAKLILITSNLITSNK